MLGWRYDPREMAHIHRDGRRVEDVDLDHSPTLRADMTPCPECGKRKVDYLTMAEAFTDLGYAASSCFTCKLTDRRRIIPASDPIA